MDSGGSSWDEPHFPSFWKCVPMCHGESFSLLALLTSLAPIPGMIEGATREGSTMCSKRSGGCMRTTSGWEEFLEDGMLYLYRVCYGSTF